MTNRNPGIISEINEDSEEAENRYAFPPWADLPSPAVEKIYSFLNRSDQKSMSLVCRNWRDGYSLPSLWRNVTLCLSDIENSAELCPEVIFARRFGCMFRHVEIVFPLPTSNSLDVPLSLPEVGIVIQLILFLEAVTRHSQLISITFKYMFFSFIKAGEACLLLYVYRKFLNLLKSQNKLQYVKFIHSEFKKSDAIEILNVIFVNNSKTLTHLILHGFVKEQNHDKLIDNVMRDDLNYKVLMNLEILAIDYTQMFENMILSFYEYRSDVPIRKRKGRLKEVTLYCDGDSTVNYLGIQPIVWEYLGNIFPDLRIELILLSFLENVNFYRYIVPSMPLKTLIILPISGGVQMTNIRPLLSHIASCNINGSIEDLAIFLKDTFLNSVPDLISFTNFYPKMKNLEIVIEHPAAGLHALFDSWMEHIPASLLAVKITVRFDPTEKRLARIADYKTVYSNLIKFYAPLLAPLELRLSFHDDHCIFSHFTTF